MTTNAPSNLLSLTLMGHVDHGKSSYADSLLASNGLISQRQAGKIRYLDSREDEQERGITIESSGVRLGFKMRRKSPEGQAGDVEDWTLNLIDTPGHIDFSSEVSTSSRLVDGCLILVDALEGVCTQTINVLRQAWIDRLKPILVINKVDRLAVEVRMKPAEAEAQLQRVIEQANATLASFWQEERLQDEDREREAVEAKGQAYTTRVESDDDKEADAELYFDPARGNVIFSSSLYGFAFRLHSFSHLYSKKLGLPEDKFRQFLWGEWYFDGKGKRMLNRKQATKIWGESRLGPTACQQFVLDNVWRVFEKTVLERDQEAVEKIVSTLSLNVPPRDLKTTDNHALLASILSAWLPLAPCTFSTIVDQIPPPPIAQGRRLPRILDPLGRVWPSEQTRFYADKCALERPQGRIDVERDLFEAKRGQNAWRTAVISKMFAVAREDLPGEVDGKDKDAESNGKAGQREDIRNLSVEERRRRAKEARERLQASKQTQEQQGTSSPSVEAQQAPAPQADSREDSNPEDTSASVVTIDANYTRPEPAAAPIDKAANGTSEEGAEEVLLAFVRVYSGSLSSSVSSADSAFFLLLPKYNTTLPPRHPTNVKHLKRVHIEALYVIMGKELVKVQNVQAGEVCAVRGLEGVVGRMGTLVALPQAQVPSNLAGIDDADLAERTSSGFVNLTSGTGLAAPIVRVALEPNNPLDLPKLVHGLRLLNQSDPCVQTLVQETGEHVIVTAGELHLERCLKDLRERFAKCGITASKPLVPFRETAVRVSEMPPPKYGNEGDPRGTVNISIANGAVKVKLRAKPLPNIVTEFLEANAATVRALLDQTNRGKGPTGDAGDESTQSSDPTITTTAQAAETGLGASISKVVSPSQFFPTLKALLQKAGSSAKAWEQEWKEEDLVDRIWAFGPRGVGANLFVGPKEGLDGAAAPPQRGLKNRVDIRAHAGSGLPTPAVKSTLEQDGEGDDLSSALQKATLDDENHSVTTSSSSSSFSALDLLDSLDTGFQLSTFQGPLCSEPVRGLCYFLESLTLDHALIASSSLRLSTLTGSLISSMRSACHSGLQDWSPRLLLAMYEAEVQSTPEVLGKVHAVLSRRRGRVLSEEMKDGTSYFTITALVPVIESFGLADELRSRTSGLASPQLVFRGFQLYDLDPFWVPRTELELEDLGDKDERENVAKRYMDAVRRRKGMHVDDKLTFGAEKQRNLKSN